MRIGRIISPQISMVSKYEKKKAFIQRIKEAISIARKCTGRERVVEYKKEPERSITR